MPFRHQALRVLPIAMLVCSLVGPAQAQFAQQGPKLVGASAITIFDYATPKTPVVLDTGAVTLGVKFLSARPGKVLGIRFYRGATNRLGYVVKLFAASGRLLAAAKTWKDTCVVPCWEQVNFASPVSLAANTTYVAAYYASSGRYAADKFGLTDAHSAGPLTAPASGAIGGNGVYTYSTGFPSTTASQNFYVIELVHQF
jgi:hypothetical protein